MKKLYQLFLIPPLRITDLPSLCVACADLSEVTADSPQIHRKIKIISRILSENVAKRNVARAEENLSFLEAVLCGTQAPKHLFEMIAAQKGSAFSKPHFPNYESGYSSADMTH